MHKRGGQGTTIVIIRIKSSVGLVDSVYCLVDDVDVV